MKMNKIREELEAHKILMDMSEDMEAKHYHLGFIDGILFATGGGDNHA